MDSEQLRINERRTKIVRIGERHILNLLMGLEVMEIPELPAGERFDVLGVHDEFVSRSLLIRIRHDSFDVVPEGCQSPEVELHLGRRQPGGTVGPRITIPGADYKPPQVAPSAWDTSECDPVRNLQEMAARIRDDLLRDNAPNKAAIQQAGELVREVDEAHAPDDVSPTAIEPGEFLPDYAKRLGKMIESKQNETWRERPPLI